MCAAAPGKDTCQVRQVFYYSLNFLYSYISINFGLNDNNRVTVVGRFSLVDSKWVSPVLAGVVLIQIIPVSTLV